MIAVTDLSACALFAGLPAEALTALNRLARLERLGPGTLVFAENDPAEDVYIVKRGRVALSFSFLHHGQRLRVEITQVEPPDVFGWSALTTARRLSAAAETVVDSEIWRLNGDQLRSLMDADPRLGYHIMSRLTDLISTRLRDSRERLRALLEWQ